jgi:hypothetical protein
MAKKKRLYPAYEMEEVRDMESNYFCIQFGEDFMCEDGHHLFTKNEISILYNRTLKNLRDIISKGSDKDRKHALKLIGGLIVRPMRLH